MVLSRHCRGLVFKVESLGFSTIDALRVGRRSRSKNKKKQLRLSLLLSWSLDWVVVHDGKHDDC